MDKGKTVDFEYRVEVTQGRLALLCCQALSCGIQRVSREKRAEMATEVSDSDYVCMLTDESAKKAKDELNEDPKNRLGAVQTFRELVLQQPHIKCPTGIPQYMFGSSARLCYIRQHVLRSVVFVGCLVCSFVTICWGRISRIWLKCMPTRLQWSTQRKWHLVYQCSRAGCRHVTLGVKVVSQIILDANISKIVKDRGSVLKDQQ